MRTAGRNKPSPHELECYHFLIDTDGNIYKGKYAPEDNLNCNDRKYAAHCGGGNTGNIGIAFCGCYVPNGIPVKNSQFPLTRIQLEKGFALGAVLCKKYGIKISKNTVFTHYEFGIKHPNTSSAGKIDITYMHPFPAENKMTCGDFIRNKVKWYFNQ
ncbi:MAG: N-acetylmuramoyl-L-alanine amidase [Turicibacter sp.]|nr:N-acetylmuramoyl-L-alanine amidase [Turicibacter sp.]